VKNLGAFLTYRISLSLEIIATRKPSHESLTFQKRILTLSMIFPASCSAVISTVWLFSLSPIRYSKAGDIYRTTHPLCCSLATGIVTRTNPQLMSTLTQG